MTFLNFSEQELSNGGGLNTAREIAQQSALFRKLGTLMPQYIADAAAFIAEVTKSNGYDIIMTGAGSSEMIGNALLPVLYPHHTNGQIRSIGTTSLLTSPELYFDQADRPTLLVSFARSGNSPESVGVVELANKVLRNVRHLFITCNEDGALAKIAAQTSNAACIQLPAETNDKGFAMTSSVTSMYLSGYALLSGMSAEAFAAQAAPLADAAAHYVEGCVSDILKLANTGFERVVYLGADNLKGTAQECALKMLELTNGNCATLFDTPMGFRHGPKSFVTDNTLVVVFLSKDAYTRVYEIDILKELFNGSRTCTVAAVSFTDAFKDEYAPFCHVDFTYAAANSQALEQPALSALYVILGQLLAFGISFCNGHKTDTPCPDNAVSRVVSGVTVHPYNK